ncbi:MAG: RNA-binding S4 domain-containing protein [Anaerovoracaceae bacterium]
MRIDKFLKNSRIIKRRTIAKEACEQERITVNDKIAKPGTEVKEGDLIHIQFGNKEINVKVLNLIESQRKEDAEKMYEVIEK